MKKLDDSKREINEPGPLQLARLHHERDHDRSDADRCLAKQPADFPDQDEDDETNRESGHIEHRRL